MSYVKDKGNGKYQLIADFGYLDSGKRDRRVKTIEAKNKREAAKQLSLFESALMSDSRKVDERIKFPAFVERWKKEFGSVELDPNTYEIYCYELDKSMIHFFKHKRLADIKTYDVVRYMNEEKRNGSGPYALEKRHRVLRSVFGKAKEWEVIKTDPTRNVKRPKIKRREKEVYSDEEIDILLDKIQRLPVHHKLMILLALMGGLRRGEVLGIDLDKDLDFKKNRIHVCHSLQKTKVKGLRLKACKADSERYVSLPKKLMAEIKMYRKARWKERNECKEWIGFKDEKDKNHFLLFSHINGYPYDPHSISNMWRKLVISLGIKKISFHDLRHSAATFWLRKGKPMKSVQVMLGHKDITTTMNLYAHVLEEDKEDLANLYEDVLEKHKKENLGNVLGNEDKK